DKSLILCCPFDEFDENQNFSRLDYVPKIVLPSLKNLDLTRTMNAGKSIFSTFISWISVQSIFVVGQNAKNYI
uniref:Uncharacterized protein n=1 Tax=Romanomermis culicivorax TaxID=13658 RepID=A0A915K8G8_ROMCU